MYGLEPGQVIDGRVYNNPLRSWVSVKAISGTNVLGHQACCAICLRLEAV
jgi:hypothetical protein